MFQLWFDTLVYYLALYFVEFYAVAALLILLLFLYAWYEDLKPSRLKGKHRNKQNWVSLDELMEGN